MMVRFVVFTDRDAAVGAQRAINVAHITGVRPNVVAGRTSGADIITLNGGVWHVGEDYQLVMDTIMEAVNG